MNSKTMNNSDFKCAISSRLTAGWKFR